MEVQFTKEDLQKLRRKELSHIIPNFGQGVIRFTFDECVNNHSFTNYYHVKCYRRKDSRETGSMYINRYYLAGFFHLIRPTDTVCFNIELSGDKEFLKMWIVRGKKELQFYPFCHATHTKDGRDVRPSKQNINWNVENDPWCIEEFKFNEYQTFQ